MSDQPVVHPIYLSVQQLAMAEIALMEKAKRCDNPSVAIMYRIEAQNYSIARQRFMSGDVHLMSAKYHAIDSPEKEG